MMDLLRYSYVAIRSRGELVLMSLLLSPLLPEVCRLRAMGGGQGERRVRPRRQAGIDGGVVGSDAVAAVAEGRERRRGFR